MSTALADRKTEIRPAREREPEAGALAAVRPPLYAKGTVPHLVALGRVTGAITRQLAISAEFRSDEGGLSLHAGADLPENSLDAIINSFILHEVYSSTQCSEKSVEQIVERHFRYLKPEGLLFIRDFSLPDASYVLLEMPDEPSYPQNGIHGLSEPELLIQYSEKARPREDMAHRGFYLEELPPRFPRTRLFRLPYKWAYEFIMRKDDREY
ncbi:MAG: hypothetical protein DI596_12900, partial [Azospira oryzae]